MRKVFALPKRYYNGPVSDHFDGTRFFHPGLPPADKSLLDVLRWKRTSHPARWPQKVSAVIPAHPEPRVDGLRITHVGHSSYLVQVAGRNLLVDPVWSERASPLRWAGPQRHTAPGILLGDLPPLDAVLVTHNHYDHMDVSTLAELWKTHRAHVLTPLGNDTILRKAIPGIVVEAGDWWDGSDLGDGLTAGKLRVTIVPAYHWSSRGLGDRRMALWGGFVIESAAGVVYCAGDTAWRDGAIFTEIARRFPAPDVAVLPVGAYAPRWFMSTQHCNPDEAVQMARVLGAKQVLGVHWGTFQLTDEPWDEPPRLLAEAVRPAECDAARFQALVPGTVWPPLRDDSPYAH